LYFAERPAANEIRASGMVVFSVNERRHGKNTASHS